MGLVFEGHRCHRDRQRLAIDHRDPHGKPQPPIAVARAQHDCGEQARP